MEGTPPKTSRSWCGSRTKLDSASSQEELRRSESSTGAGSREGIGIAVTTERVVEFEAIVVPGSARAGARPKTNPSREEPFVVRGGFY